MQEGRERVLSCDSYIGMCHGIGYGFLGAESLVAGLEIATDTVANATNIFSLATKNSSLVAKVVTRFLYDLDLK